MQIPPVQESTEQNGHSHTANPFLNDPWCAICDALLAKAILYEEWFREELATFEEQHEPPTEETK